jgi:Tfp pilus assembly protein PilF
MKNRSLNKLAAVGAGLLLLAGLGFSQSGRGVGRLGGVVVDVQGVPLEGIKVALVFQRDMSPKFDTVTNKKGEFSFMALGSGIFLLSAYGKGYDPVNNQVNVSQLQVNPKVTITMKKSEKVGGGLIEDESTFAMLEKGNTLFREQKYDEAIVQFQAFIEKNPLAYQVEINIADCYREKGDIAKATEMYNKIVERAQTDQAMGKEMAARALAGLGNIMIKQNKIAEAQDFFKRSIENSPKDEVLAYNVGEIYFSNQGYDDAIKYFEMAIQIKPDWPDPYERLGSVFLNKADTASAVAKYEKFLTLEPEGQRAERVKAILGVIKK